VLEGMDAVSPDMDSSIHGVSRKSSQAIKLISGGGRLDAIDISGDATGLD